MKKELFLFLIVSLLLISSSSAQQEFYRLGLGVRLSNAIPTLNNAITGKYFITDKTAVEGMASFGSRFGIGGLIEIHNPLDFEGLRWVYGGGMYIGFEEGKTFFGPTAMLGLDYKFEEVPINLSLDWKPELDITPKGNFVPDAFALSVRFTLK